jgi:hypothetical protein
MRAAAALLLTALAASLGAGSAARPAPQKGLAATVKCTVTVSEVPATAKRLRLWIPLPKSDRFQTIENLTITPKTGETRTEALYGNAFHFVEVPASVKLPFEVVVQFDLTRKEETIHAEPEDPEVTARCLAPDRLGAVDDAVRALANKATFEERSTMRVARALYNFVLDNVQWADSGEAVGRGDVAAVVKSMRGNAADLSALYLALCRSMGIPARYQAGFLLTADGRVVPHAWASFVARERGWVPVDLGEARQAIAKDPAKREAFFGTLTENRFLLSTGRDIVLTAKPPAQSVEEAPTRSILVDPPPAGAVVTTFAAPYADADDKPVSVRTEWLQVPRKK